MFPSLKAHIMGLDPENYMLPCISKQVFGIECPGCGLQRSLALLIQGDFTASFMMYPALMPMMALFGLLILNRFVSIPWANRAVMALAGITVFAILGNFALKIII